MKLRDTGSNSTLRSRLGVPRLRVVATGPLQNIECNADTLDTLAKRVEQAIALHHVTEYITDSDYPDIGGFHD